MIELPEARVLAEQMNKTLKGKTIVEAVRGQTPHRFAFKGKHSDEEFAKIVAGKKVGKSWADGMCILTEMQPRYLLSLGIGGESIQYHTDASTLPTKHQLLLRFADEDYLSVTVSGWGETRLLEAKNLDDHPHIRKDRLTPFTKEFTLGAFKDLIACLAEGKKCSAKKFFVSKPGLNGIGNGVIQEIFFHAGVNPKQEMSELTQARIKKLYNVTLRELQRMIDQGGRDGHKDLFGSSGGYQRAMHSKTAGTPCTVCKTKTVKESYLGGSVYYCPSCQKL